MCYPIIFAVNPVNTGRRTTVNNAPRIGSQLWLCSVLVFFLVPAAPHLFTCSMTVMRDEILKRELFACLAALGTTTWTRIGWPGPGQASFTCRVAAPAPAWSLQERCALAEQRAAGLDWEGEGTLERRLRDWSPAGPAHHHCHTLRA